ncbi:MAG TPA: nucleoside triphosphate pyrophosphohydrolase family protein [Candidatus Lumbricidophila sp.]|nr:nucleoside triphosphate pyrophosphohydrolase family protein [Candidatus Lumbricidophila sp.]
MQNYTNPMQQAVAEFHRAFGHPDRIATPGALPEDRIDLRLSLIREEGIVELREAINSHDVIAIVDALIDTVYVSLGCLVEMGLPLIQLWRPLNTDTADRATILDISGRVLLTNEMNIKTLERNLRGRSETAAVVLSQLVWDSLDALSDADLDPQPFFDEVQRANMSKLGADGKPVISRGIELDGYPEGKVLKGANYAPPNLSRVFHELYGQPAN